MRERTKQAMSQPVNEPGSLLLAGFKVRVFAAAAELLSLQAQAAACPLRDAILREEPTLASLSAKRSGCSPASHSAGGEACARDEAAKPLQPLTADDIEGIKAALLQAVATGSDAVWEMHSPAELAKALRDAFNELDVST